MLENAVKMRTRVTPNTDTFYAMNAFQGISKLQKQTCGEIKGTPPYLTCNNIDQNLPFLIFFVQICSGGSS